MKPKKLWVSLDSSASASITDRQAVAEARSLRNLTPQQWKSGIAAWLGWLFDGLDMHLCTLVAAPFVMQLLQADSLADPLVKRYSSWIQAAFLVGWALGGGVFGRLGDLLGRSRALCLTILLYALFTGLSSVADLHLRGPHSQGGLGLTHPHIPPSRSGELGA